MNRKTPKKQVIINFLLSEINKGNLKIGDKIPSEFEIAKQFNFGRQTVHSALSDLALQGIIKRTAGKGSFVANPPANRNIQKKKSFTEDMQSIGLKAGNKLLEFKIIKGSDLPDVAKELHVNDDETIYKIIRLRLGNDTPIAIQHTFIPTKFIDNFNLSELDNSLDVYIEKCGYKITDFITKLRAVEATKEQMDILKTNNRAILNSISMRYIKNKVPFQFTLSYYRSDLYEYTFSSFSN